MNRRIAAIMTLGGNGAHADRVHTHGAVIVDGLGRLSLEMWLHAWPDDTTDFMYRYVQPLWKDGREDPESMERCKAFLRTHPRWALSRQDHKHWGVL